MFVTQTSQKRDQCCHDNIRPVVPCILLIHIKFICPLIIMQIPRCCFNLVTDCYRKWSWDSAASIVIFMQQNLSVSDEWTCLLLSAYCSFQASRTSRNTSGVQQNITYPDGLSQVTTNSGLKACSTRSGSETTACQPCFSEVRGSVQFPRKPEQGESHGHGHNVT